ETRHPFVVKLLCSFQDEADVHLVLEHHRCDLSMRIADYTALNKAFPRDLLRFYIAELCAAVAVLHADGIIHRDIKPANILIDTDGHLVLADMGMATEPLPMAAAARAPISPAWVRAGDSVAHVHALEARAGTYYYTAPEILMGWQYGSAVDWWSVGAVM
ncbi:kinase-like domain-containing protein, partial [Schizophyllum fasciatum]